MKLSIPFVDKLLLALGHKPTRIWYSNPISSSGRYASLFSYLTTLSPSQRSWQAELLLRLPICSVLARSYADCVPSRAQIVFAAASANNLDPELLSAFLLAEQRDQSRNEDAAEYAAAISVLRADTSIGLAQVRISGVKRWNLFRDLLSPATCAKLSRKNTITFLVSDEFNIFAAARCIRTIADLGSRTSNTTSPRIFAVFTHLVPEAYGQNSLLWPLDNIRAVASNYTTSPWNDAPVTDWAEFVLEAYRDVVSSGVFQSKAPAMQETILGEKRQ